jgi:hypothetical protein
MKSTDTPTASKILEQAQRDIAEKYGYASWSALAIKCDRSYDTEASLLAMERIAEMSWEACLLHEKEPNHRIEPDKSTYMNNLFEREQPKQASIYCDCEDYTSIDRNGNCRTCGGEVKE